MPSPCFLLIGRITSVTLHRLLCFYFKQQTRTTTRCCEIYNNNKIKHFVQALCTTRNSDVRHSRARYEEAAHIQKCSGEMTWRLVAYWGKVLLNLSFSFLWKCRGFDSLIQTSSIKEGGIKWMWHALLERIGLAPWHNFNSRYICFSCWCTCVVVMIRPRDSKRLFKITYNKYYRCSYK